MVAHLPSRSSRFELVDGPLQPKPEGSTGGGGPSRGSWRGSSTIVVLVGAAVLVLLAAMLLPHGARDPSTPLPTPSPMITSPTPPSASCDLRQEGCRVVTAARWRDRTAMVLRERLDPEDTYFTGYSYSVNPRYTTGQRLDALGLQVYRLEGGGTEVFVQIAKTRADAVRCGAITHQRCVGQRFMDGNRFSMTTTSGVEEGIEVQHSPAGTYVITLVAHNTTGGRALELNNGDLIAVAQDPRLQPPPS